MSVTNRANPAASPLLWEGQRLDRRTFHALYERTPPGFKAELIGGVVHVPSPLGRSHGETNDFVAGWLFLYRCRTPGVQALLDATTFLDDEGEAQPDAQLRILPDYGGRTRNVGKYLEDGPELVVEVSVSSRLFDLGPKRADYERAGVLEYLVVAVEPGEVIWHARREGRLVPIEPDADGLYRSATFPGLWLNPEALLAGDGPALIGTLERGLATPEHAAFVATLAAARRKETP